MIVIEKGHLKKRQPHVNVADLQECTVTWDDVNGLRLIGRDVIDGRRWTIRLAQDMVRMVAGYASKPDIA